MSFSHARSKKKKGRVRRAGGWSGGPPPLPPAAVTERLRNSRNVRHKPVRFKKKKHPFVKIIEKTPFRCTDIQWPHDQRDQAGGKTWEGKLAVCGRKPLYALARSGTQYHLLVLFVSVRICIVLPPSYRFFCSCPPIPCNFMAPYRSCLTSAWSFR